MQESKILDPVQEKGFDKQLYDHIMSRMQNEQTFKVRIGDLEWIMIPDGERIKLIGTPIKSAMGS